MTWKDWFFERPHRRVYGWWVFDDTHATLERADGARLRFVGPASDDHALAIRNTGNRRWMRFELHTGRYGGDSLYPLLVERRDVLDPVRPSAGRRLVWRLDHIRSAKLASVQPPDPVLWRTVDRLAIDALYCWPDGSRAGVRPANVAVSGGWRGGRWTSDFYRAFSGSGIGAYPGEGRFADAPPEAPDRWDMILPARPLSIEDAQAQFRALLSAAPRDVAALVPALTTSRPHLRSLGGRLLVPLFTSSADPAVLRWLYVDEALMTDRLRSAASARPPSFAPEWTFSLDFRNCLVGTIDLRTGEYFDFTGISPWYTERVPRYQGPLLFEAGHFAPQTLARFREVVSDAVWSWQDVELVLPGEDGVAKQVRLGAPAQTGLWPATQFGGTERATTMSAAPGLQHAAGRIHLAWMFGEDDGYAPPAREVRVGRLDFDGSALVMTDRETGQTLSFEQTLDGSADAASEQLGLFVYGDAGTSYPIVVRRTARTTPDTGAEWAVGHGASAERWLAPVSPKPRRGEGGYPPQELWQRVASFAVDALLAWPDTAAFGPAPRALVTVGGWWTGVWSREVRRRHSTRLLTETTWRHIREQGLHVRFPGMMSGDDPRVVVSGPADPEPTLAWQRHAWRAGEGRTSVAAESYGPTTPTITLDPPGAISVDRVDLAAFAADRLRDRYHWLRDDGGALLYVCGEHKVTSGGPEPMDVMEPLIEYCDADVRVRLHLSSGLGSIQPLSLTNVFWPRVVRGSRFHEQEGVLPSSLFRPSPYSKDAWAPQLRLWHRLADAVEAWLDPARTGERAGVTVRGVYVAGAFDWSGERKTWFEGRE